MLEALRKERPIIAGLFKLALLTGSRRGELLSAKWNHVDFQQKLINFPDTKNRLSHTVPLASAAVRVIQKLHPFSGHSQKWVFVGAGGASVQHPAKAVARLRSRSGVEFRIHDLRRTVATGLAQIGVRPDIVSAILGHTISGAQATRIYDRHHRIPEIASSLEAWAAHLDEIASGKTEGADVVAFPGA